jgi:chemotaxis signal transduction protein
VAGSTGSGGVSRGAGTSATSGGRSSGSGGGRRGGRGSRAAPEGFAATLCGFWLGNQCFAIAAAIVGEVVPVEALTPVPLAPAAVRGLFNLRGTPVAAVDLGAALGLTDVPAVEEPRPGQPLTGLVIRSGDLVVGALIRRMELVVPAGRGHYRPRGESAEESALVSGFLEIAERGALVMTVLSSEGLVDRLSALRLRPGGEEE